MKATIRRQRRYGRGTAAASAAAVVLASAARMIRPGGIARVADALRGRRRYGDQVRRPSPRDLRPPISDILLAGALTALAQFEAWSGMQYQDAPVHPGPKAVVVPVLALTTVAVAWRRIFPLGVLVLSGGLISAMALAFGAGDGGPSLFVLLLVLVYSAAAHSDRPVAVVLVTAASRSRSLSCSSSSASSPS